MSLVLYFGIGGAIFCVILAVLCMNPRTLTVERMFSAYLTANLWPFILGFAACVVFGTVIGIPHWLWKRYL